MLHRFTLARDNGVDGNALELETVQSNSLSAGAETTTVASYKGRGTSCEVAGLSPNTMYQFRLRTMNAKTRSPLSAPLEVCSLRDGDLEMSFAISRESEWRVCSYARHPCANCCAHKPPPLSWLRSTRSRLGIRFVTLSESPRSIPTCFGLPLLLALPPQSHLPALR